MGPFPPGLRPVSGAGKTPLDRSNLRMVPLEVRFQATPAHPKVGTEGTHGDTHEAAGIADAPQARTDVIPDADAAPADPLPHRQLQEEEGEPDDDEQDQVGDQVGTWKGERKLMMDPSLPALVQPRRDGEAGQSWDRLRLVHRFVCNGFGDAGQCVGSREDSHGEEQTHARGREGCHIPCHREYTWDRCHHT